MSLWNKIVIGTKFLFGGFESATDYALNLLNIYIGKGKVAANIQKAREYVGWILGYLRKYQDFCPGKWAPHYDKLLTAVETLDKALEDNKVTPEELDKFIADVKAAIAEWMAD